MSSKWSRLAFAAGLLLLAPIAAHAQKLEAGKWTGKVVPPDGPTVEVTYDVKVAGDTLAITINAAEHGSFPFANVKLADGKLTFSWSPGVEVKCELKPQTDKSWSGSCVDAGGTGGTMIMVPPKPAGPASQCTRP
jgi:hypothetical protein